MTSMLKIMVFHSISSASSNIEITSAEEQLSDAQYKKLVNAGIQGDSFSQFELGTLYEHADYVDKNLTEALRWYHLAAEQGNVMAQYNVAVMYMNGSGTAKDLNEAVKWYRLAADQGY